jgi:hypothetical protein
MQQIQNERWLVDKCKEPEFYSNIRSHSALCDEVTANVKRQHFLLAMNKVFAQTYICGYTSCQDQLTSWFQWALSLSTPMLVMFLFMLLVAPTFVVHFIGTLWRLCVNYNDHTYHGPYRPLHYQPLRDHTIQMWSIEDNKFIEQEYIVDPETRKRV